MQISETNAKMMAALQEDLAESVRVSDWEPSLKVTGPTIPGDWIPTPKQIAIMTILKEQPMLTDSTLRFLQAKQAEIARATLDVLYTPEELEQLRATMEAKP